MNKYGINVELKNVPVLDPEFIPLMRFNRAFLADAKKPVGIAVERADGQMAACRTFIHGTPEMREADCYYIERIVKTLLWMKGGFKVYVSGDERICEYLQSVYCAGGQQEFDWDYMANVFEHPFEVVLADELPAAQDAPAMRLSKGDMVDHKAFGRGMVLSVQPMGGDALVEIAFDNVGTKRLMLKSAAAHMTKA